MNVLAVGAHFDDLELGCGGTLIKHVKNGDKVTMIVVTDSGYRDPKGDPVRDGGAAHAEGLRSSKIIGAKLICLDYETFMVPFDECLTGKLSGYMDDLKIETVYSHWVHDLHRDHQHAGKCVMMAGRHVPKFLMYRSNFYDTDRQFRGNFYSDISKVMGKKLEAIKAHASEIRRVRGQWLDFISKQHENDGRKAGVKYAECFEIVRYRV